MMRPLIFALAVASAMALGRAAYSKPEQFKTRFVNVSEPWLSTVTTLWAADADSGESPVRPRINMTLTNRSDHAFWIQIRMTAPSPHRGRTGTAHLEPKQTVEFESTQDSVLADVDYGLDIAVFSDSALTDTLEHNTAQFRFDSRAVDAINQKLTRRRREHTEEQVAGERLEDRERQARQLPQSYENLMFIDKKFGMGGTMFAPRGTLTVRPDGLQFASKKRTLVLTGAQLRSVAIVMEPTQRQHDFERCVAVEYDVDGKTKRFLLLPGLTTALKAAQQGQLEMVRASLVALKDQTAKRN